MLRVHPNFYGRRNGFAAFIGDCQYAGEVTLKFHCLEKINLYEFDGNGLEEVELIFLDLTLFFSVVFFHPSINNI